MLYELHLAFQADYSFECFYFLRSANWYCCTHNMLYKYIYEFKNGLMGSGVQQNILYKYNYKFNVGIHKNSYINKIARAQEFYIFFKMV